MYFTSAVMSVEEEGGGGVEEGGDSTANVYEVMFSIFSEEG